MVVKHQTDVACIGGGPTSAIAALEILKAHKEVVIFEEHKEIGVPVNCAGLVSVNGFKKLKIKIPNECIKYRVRGSRFFSPSGYTFQVKREYIQAYVIDRAKFDKFLMDRVKDLDGKIHLNTKVISVMKENSQAIGLVVEKDRTKLKIKSKIIIDGEGVRGKFIKEMGLIPSQRDTLVPAVQFEMKNVNLEPNFVEVYIGRKIAPGFFAYVIPTSENTASVAIGSKFGKPINYIKYFIKKHPIASKKLKNSVIYKKGGGLIMIGGPIKKTYAAGFLGIGDSVGQVKATTGGGIVFGGLCAKIAGNIAVEGIEKNDFSERFLKKYQKEWHRRYLRELWLMKLLRSLLNSMPDKIIDEIFLSIINQGIPELIEEMGDIDMQGSLIKKILFSPNILKMGLAILIGIVTP
ncbi:MAG: geranylgeranyl reductase family protein [Promethearchaeota archaeon]